MQLHAVAGLPRSGSTLLCDLLNQRPDVYASSTSSLPVALATLVKHISEAETTTSELVGLPDARDRHLGVLRAVASVWHGDQGDKVTFDKSRSWAYNWPILRQIAPDSIVVVTIRDPRDVFASTERQHLATAQYGLGTQAERMEDLMKPEGLIGSAIVGVEDLVRRKAENVLYLPFWHLVTQPQDSLDVIAEKVGLDRFECDVDQVKSTAYDLDELWRFKYPHRRPGPAAVKPPKHHWSDIVSQDVADAILRAFPLYCNHFGYS